MPPKCRSIESIQSQADPLSLFTPTSHDNWNANSPHHRRLTFSDDYLTQALADAKQWLDERYKALSEADERAEKAEANLRRAIEIAEALSSELYFPDFVAEIAAMKTSPSSL